MINFEVIDIEKLTVTLTFIIGILVIQYSIQLFLSFLIKKSQKIVLDDIKVGIVILLRISSGLIIIYFLNLVYELPNDFILAISLLIGAIISLSSSKLLSNILAGVYIYWQKPYQVNDFITIGGFEGKVIKFNLNITKLLTIDNTYIVIQNRNIFKSEIINYSFYKKRIIDQNLIIQSLNLQLSQEIKLKKYVEYSFQISCPLKFYSKTKEKIDQVCVGFENRFAFKPMYYPISLGFKLDLQFIVLTPNAERLMHNIKEFKLTLLESIY